MAPENDKRIFLSLFSGLFVSSTIAQVSTDQKSLSRFVVSYVNSAGVISLG